MPASDSNSCQQSIVTTLSYCACAHKGRACLSQMKSHQQRQPASEFLFLMLQTADLKKELPSDLNEVTRTQNELPRQTNDPHQVYYEKTGLLAFNDNDIKL